MSRGTGAGFYGHVKGGVKHRRRIDRIDPDRNRIACVLPDAQPGVEVAVIGTDVVVERRDVGAIALKRLTVVLIPVVDFGVVLAAPHRHQLRLRGLPVLHGTPILPRRDRRLRQEE